MRKNVIFSRSNDRECLLITMHHERRLIAENAAFFFFYDNYLRNCKYFMTIFRFFFLHRRDVLSGMIHRCDETKVSNILERIKCKSSTTMKKFDLKCEEEKMENFSILTLIEIRLITTLKKNKMKEILSVELLDQQRIILFSHD